MIMFGWGFKFGIGLCSAIFLFDSVERLIRTLIKKYQEKCWLKKHVSPQDIFNREEEKGGTNE